MEMRKVTLEHELLVIIFFLDRSNDYLKQNREKDNMICTKLLTVLS